MPRLDRRRCLTLLALLFLCFCRPLLASHPTRDVPTSNNGICTTVLPACPSQSIFFLDAPYTPVSISGGGLTGVVKLFRVGSFQEQNPLIGPQTIGVGRTLISVILGAAPANVASQSITVVGVSPTVGRTLINPWYAIGGTRIDAQGNTYTDPYAGNGMKVPAAFYPSNPPATAHYNQSVDLISAATPVSNADGNAVLWTFDPTNKVNAPLASAITLGSVSLLVDGFPDATAPSKATITYPSDLPSGSTIATTSGNGLAGMTAANVEVIVHVVYTDGTTGEVALGGLSLAGGTAPCPSADVTVTCHPPATQPFSIPSFPYSEVTRLDAVPRSAGELTYPLAPEPTCNNFIANGPSAFTRSIQYQFKPTVTQQYTIDTTGSHFDSVVLLSSTDDPTYATAVCTDDQSDGSVQAKLSNALLTAGKTYTITIGEFPAFTEYPCSSTGVFGGQSQYCSATPVPAPASSNPVLILSVSVSSDVTSTSLACTPTTGGIGVPLVCAATVSDSTTPSTSVAGTVQFAFTPAGSTTPVLTLAGTVANGVVQVSTQGLPAATYTVSATFASSALFATSTASQSGVIRTSQPTSLTAITSGTVSLYTDLPLYVTLNQGNATLLPTGTYSLLENNLQIGVSQNVLYGFDLRPQSVGVHTYQLRYSGDSNYGSSISPAFQVTVGKAPTSAILNTSTFTVVKNASITLQASVSVAVPYSYSSYYPNQTYAALTGTVTFYDGTTSLGTANVVNGNATLTTSTLVPGLGTHQITVQYNGDSNYLVCTSSATDISVVGYNSSVTATASTAATFVGSTFNITASVVKGTGGTTTPTGTFTLISSQQSGTPVPIAVSANPTVFLVTAQQSGINSYVVQYSGDTQYAASNSSTIQVVVNENNSTLSLTSPSPIGLNSPIVLTATVTNTSGTSVVPDGTVSFTSVPSSPVLYATLVNGVATATNTTLSSTPGTYSFTASYQGSPTFNIANPSSVQVTVLPLVPTATSLVVAPTAPVAGSTLTVTASVNKGTGTATPTGTLTLLDGGVAVGGTMSAGAAPTVFTVANLAVGAHSYTVAYSGDKVYAASASTTSAITAAKDSISVTLAATATTVALNGSDTYTATVSNNSGTALIPTGSVTFLRGATVLGTGSINAGIATLTTTAASTPAGSASIDAQYSGDANFNTATSSPLPLTVLYPTTTAATVAPAIVVAGTTLTVTASINKGAATATPTGALTLFDGATQVGSPVSPGPAPTVFTITNAAQGAHSYTVAYSGDAVFSGSTSAAAALTVGKDASAVSITASPSPVPFNTAVTLTATLSNLSGTSFLPSGSVIFFNGLTSLGAGTISGTTATLTTSAFTGTAGTYAITAQYAGDSNFGASTSAAASVSVLSLVTTTTSASPSASALPIGTSFTITSGVARASGTTTPTGTLSLFDGPTQVGASVAVSTSPAVFTVANSTVGTHSYTVRYSGDSLYAGSVSSAASVVVSLDGSATALALSGTTLNQNASLTLTATIANTARTGLVPSGTVTFLSGGSTIGTATLVNGVATLTNTALSATAGTYTITASYAGDGNFSPSASPASSLTVIAPDFTFKPESSSLTLSQGQSGTLKLDVLSTGGFAQTVSFSCSGLPTSSSCSFLPASLTADPTGNAAVTTISISTTSPGIGALAPAPKLRESLTGVLSVCALLWFARRRRPRQRWAGLVLVALLAVSAFGLAGCASSNNQHVPTPKGTYNVTLTAASATGGSRTTTISLTVQ